MDLRRRALGMSRNVCQGFLHDAEQYQFRIGREPLHRRRDVNLDGDAATLHEALDVMTKRQAQSGLVEQWRMEKIENRANVADRLLKHVFELSKGRLRDRRQRF